MDVRRPMDLQFLSADKRRKSQKIRAGVFAALTMSAGASCGLAAVLGLGPFGALHASANYAGTRQPAVAPTAPIEARSLFPAVPPVTKVVYVNDPPRAPRPPEMKPKTAHESSGARVHSTPSPSAKPSEYPGDE